MRKYAYVCLHNVGFRNIFAYNYRCMYVPVYVSVSVTVFVCVCMCACACVCVRTWVRVCVLYTFIL